MADPTTLSLEWRGGVAVLTLDRPDRLNAITALMHEELRAALAQVEARDGLRGLIITGAGRGFCAGQDLGERQPLPAGGKRDLGEGIEKNYNPFVKRLAALPAPVICVVNGVAAGAGASLAFCCDVIIAARSARFVLSFTRIGLGPDAGASHFLPQRIGRTRAAGMMIFGEPVDAQRALDWGLVWKLVEDEDVASEIEAMARWLDEAPTAALAAVKSLLGSSDANDLSAQLACEAHSQRALGFSDDYAEGVAAFLEKRPARFKGAAPAFAHSSSKGPGHA